MPYYRYEVAFTPQQWTSAVASVPTATAGIDAFVGPHARAFGVSARPAERRMAFFVDGLKGPGKTMVVGPFGGRVDSIRPLYSPPDVPTDACENCGLAGHTLFNCPFP